MKNKTKALLLASLLYPGVAMAAVAPGITLKDSGKTDIASILESVTNFVLGFSAIIAVLFLIFGGLKYVTSGGNKDSVESAKSTILYAIIGLVIIILAWVIVKVVMGTIDKIF